MSSTNLLSTNFYRSHAGMMGTLLEHEGTARVSE